MTESDNMKPKFNLSKGDILAAIIGGVLLLWIASLIGGGIAYVYLKSQPVEVKVIERNNTIIAEKNTSIVTVMNVSKQEEVHTPDVTIYSNGTVEIPTTTTTIESYRIDSNGRLLPEDAERLMEKVRQQLANQLTTTTTTTVTVPFNRASSIGLYYALQAQKGGGTYVINRTVETSLRTNDGSDKWSHGTRPELVPVTLGEARYYLDNLGSENVEGVYYKLFNGTLIRIRDLTWVYQGG